MSSEVQMNDIDERLQKLEEAVRKLGADIGMMRRTIDLFLMGIQMNYIDERLQKLEKTVWNLERDLNESQRVIDLLLVNDPESEVRKHFVERAKKKLEHIDALRKAERKVVEMRFEIEDILFQHPELREVYETRR